MKLRLLCSILLVGIQFVQAQHSYIPSEQIYTTEDGLLSNKIHTIHKDTYGFIWIGTETGLNRFDGQSFESYTAVSHPQMTIERIQTIAEDDAGFLWLLEPNETFEHSFQSPEVNLFNINTGEFTTLEERFEENLPFEVRDIRYMQQLSDGSIFIYAFSLHKAFFYTTQDGFKPISIPEEIAFMTNVERVQDGQLLVEGVYTDLDNLKMRSAIYKIDGKGEIVVKQKARLIIPVINKDETQYLDLNDDYVAKNSSYLDAFKIFAPTLASSYSKPSVIIDQVDYTA